MATRGYTAVKLEYIDPRAEKLTFTAKKDFTIEGENGASVTISKGEKFYAVRASSLGPNMFYIVRCVPGIKKCSCASTKPCVHEKCVSTGRSLVELKAEVEARAKGRVKARKSAKVVERPAQVVDISEKRDMLDAPLNGNKPFTLLKVS